MDIEKYWWTFVYTRAFTFHHYFLEATSAASENSYFCFPVLKRPQKVLFSVWNQLISFRLSHMEATRPGSGLGRIRLRDWLRGHHRPIRGRHWITRPIRGQETPGQTSGKLSGSNPRLKATGKKKLYNLRVRENEMWLLSCKNFARAATYSRFMILYEVELVLSCRTFLFLLFLQK